MIVPVEQAFCVLSSVSGRANALTRADRADAQAFKLNPSHWMAVTKISYKVNYDLHHNPEDHHTLKVILLVSDLPVVLVTLPVLL